MRNITLTIEYDGTDYCGWQRQKNGVSIQGLIEKALRKILGGKVKVTGAARTDSGVHANGQAASFKTDSRIPLPQLKKALNANLPGDITVSGIGRADKDFNAQFSAKTKLYRYAIYNREARSPFYDRFSLYAPQRLNIQAIRKGAKALLGRHDFSSFKGSKGVTKSQVRTIKKISISKKSDFIFIDIEADGFLYNMARNIAGTLLEIARGKIKPNSVRKILAAKNRSKAGPTAPAKGLTLIKVKY